MESYYINSNSGDYISLRDGVYSITLLSKGTTTIISYSQFKSLKMKGFIPIKKKKLFNNRVRKKYGPTLSNGTKGKPSVITIPTQSDIREDILNTLL